MNQTVSFRQRTINAIATFAFFMTFGFGFNNPRWDVFYEVVDAQPHWRAPSASNTAMVACFDGLNTYYGQAREGYEKDLLAPLESVSTNQEGARILIATGTIIVIAISGPWTAGALIGGTISMLAVQPYFRGQQENHSTNFANRVSDLTASANVAVGICRSAHLDG